jgi:4-hydroxy-3-polyprenylbenzoate decarboxylase
VKRALVALTGASGVVYGLALVHRLLDADVPTEVILTQAARRVLAVEHGPCEDVTALLRSPGRAMPALHAPGDLEAPPASGSSAPDTMIIAPCSMGTAARVATGISTCLVERAADVMLKERRPLVVVPRETPLSTLHLRTLLTLSEMGVHVVPAMPAYYFRPEGMTALVEFVVDRAIQAAGLPLPLRHPWEGSLPDGAGT